MVSQRTECDEWSRRAPGPARRAQPVADPGSAPPAPALSPADARLLEGVAVGATTGDLAAALHLSRSGVEYRLAALVRRLGVANRSALVARAYSLGLLAVGTWPPRAPGTADPAATAQERVAVPIAARSPSRSDTASFR